MIKKLAKYILWLCLGFLACSQFNLMADCDENQLVCDMFTKLPTIEDWWTEELWFDTYPNVAGFAYTQEKPLRKIDDLTQDEKLRLKTIIAHMYEKSQIISRIVLLEEDVSEVENLDIDEKLKGRLLQLHQSTLQEMPNKTELYNAMKVLFALLIKDSYCFTRETRSLVIDFIDLAGLESILSEVQVKSVYALNQRYGFINVYMDPQPAFSSAFFNTQLVINKDQRRVHAFAFSSENLKPSALPSQLEVEWPFNN